MGAERVGLGERKGERLFLFNYKFLFIYFL